QNAPSGDCTVSETYDPVLHYRQRRQMSRAEVSTSPQPHKGLGLDLYTNFTSPIRRYIDLLMHRQIKSILHHQAPYYSEEALKEILLTLEPTITQAQILEQDRKRYWLYRYLEREVGKPQTAVVLEAFPNRYRLLLPDYLIETDIPLTGTSLAPGDTLTVVIESVHARLGILKVVAS
ncbi:MAG: RNB domain-containing ribonuclease, partial [Nitrospinota bacterium]